MKNIKIVLLAGGTCSGKTSIANDIIKYFPNQKIKIIPQDAFYKNLPEGEDPNTYNFDHPNAFDFDLMYKVFLNVKNGIETEYPIYDYITHQRTQETVKISSCDILIFEGILCLYYEKIREMTNIKVFVDTPADIRLIRRIQRDTKKRGRKLECILEQYQNTVSMSHEMFVEPTKKYANIIIPRGRENKTGIKAIVSLLQN